MNSNNWIDVWQTPQNQKDIRRLQIQYDLYLKLQCSLILVDRVDKTLWQWFPTYNIDKIRVKCQPCTHNLKWVLANFLPSSITLKKHPFNCPAETSQMTRLHFTCLFCRVRRQIIGEYPQLYPLERYQIFVVKNRNHHRIKEFLRRKLGVLTESVCV